MPKTYNDAVYPQIPFLIRAKRYKIGTNHGEKGYPDQLYNLSFSVTNLIRDERIKLNYNRGTEVRPYVERLIVEAMRNGDQHKPTMALANYWLREKNLIHKLFKVLVPRYENYASSFTALHMLGQDYSVHNIPFTMRREMPKYVPHLRGQVILELRGNSLPPITRPKLQKSGLLTNMLLDGARESYDMESKLNAMKAKAEIRQQQRPESYDSQID